MVNFLVHRRERLLPEIKSRSQRHNADIFQFKPDAQIVPFPRVPRARGRPSRTLPRLGWPFIAAGRRADRAGRAQKPCGIFYLILARTLPAAPPSLLSAPRFSDKYCSPRGVGCGGGAGTPPARAARARLISPMVLWRFISSLRRNDGMDRTVNTSSLPSACAGGSGGGRWRQTSGDAKVAARAALMESNISCGRVERVERVVMGGARGRGRVRSVGRWVEGRKGCVQGVVCVGGGWWGPDDGRPRGGAF